MSQKKYSIDHILKAYETGLEEGWQATGEGHNAEYVSGHGTHDGKISFRKANPDHQDAY